MEKRIISSDLQLEDKDIDLNIRPLTLEEYIGQTAIKDNIKIFIEAAKQREEALDHVLLYGPPGLGKTTMAGVIASEMNVKFKVTSGPAIERPGDIAAILNNLQHGDILFIDEIHRMSRQVEEVLYSAMEDYCIDIVVGKGPAAKSIRLSLPKFTLIGATTKIGSLSPPLRDRFGIIFKFNYYNNIDISNIIKRSAKIYNSIIDNPSIEYLSNRTRGTPRIANRLLKRCADYALILNNNIINIDICISTMDKLQIDSLGLEHIEILYLKTIIDRYNGGPVGIGAIKSIINENTNTLEDIYEPYLIKLGLINRTSKGRIVTDKGYKHISNNS